MFGFQVRSLAAVSLACAAWHRRIAASPQLYRSAFWQRFGNKVDGGWWPFFESKDQLFGHRCQRVPASDAAAWTSAEKTVLLPAALLAYGQQLCLPSLPVGVLMRPGGCAGTGCTCTTPRCGQKGSASSECMPRLLPHPAALRCPAWCSNQATRSPRGFGAGNQAEGGAEEAAVPSRAVPEGAGCKPAGRARVRALACQSTGDGLLDSSIRCSAVEFCFSASLRLLSSLFLGHQPPAPTSTVSLPIKSGLPRIFIQSKQAHSISFVAVEHASSGIDVLRSKPA